jgi:Ca2+-binding RTX toxin-like protein
MAYLQLSGTFVGINAIQTEIFTSLPPVRYLDTSNLAYLGLLAHATSADYSAETGTSFTVAVGGIDFSFTGHDFTYTGMVPDGTGVITGIEADQGGGKVWSVDSSIDLLTIGHLDALLAAGSIQAICADLFSGNDAIGGTSTAAGSRIYGFGGNDVLGGGYGSDTIFGGRGMDEIGGGSGGNDRLYGGPGDDVFNPSTTGNDYIDGGTGNNWVSYALGLSPISVVLKDSGASVVQVGAIKQDTLVNIQNVFGSRSNDVIIGNNGANQLYGSAGNDSISGGGGNDNLDGGYGNDTLTGGGGNDWFTFDTLTSIPHQPNIDTITDFHPGEDLIRLGHLVYEMAFADSTLLNPDLLMHGHLPAAFFRSGPHATAGSSGTQYIIYNTTTGNLYYDPSGNGSGPVYQFAHLDGHPSVHAVNFFVF